VFTVVGEVRGVGWLNVLVLICSNLIYFNLMKCDMLEVGKSCGVITCG